MKLNKLTATLAAATTLAFGGAAAATAATASADPTTHTTNSQKFEPKVKASGDTVCTHNIGKPHNQQTGPCRH